MQRLWPMGLLLLAIGCNAIHQPTSFEAVATEDGPVPQLAAAAPTALPDLEPAEKVDLAKSHLRLASECLGRGEEDQACKHLARYVSLHPDHRTGRLFSAEILFKLHRLEDARRQYEQTLALLLEEPEIDSRSMTHVHGQLMRIADEKEDLHAAHLHRGLGLYWLAHERTHLEDPEGDFSVEGILCRAIAELARARSLRPEDARTNWYLHCCWQMLGQSPQAQARLTDAERCLPFSPMAPAEQRSLVLARRRLTDTRP